HLLRDGSDRSQGREPDAHGGHPGATDRDAGGRPPRRAAHGESASDGDRVTDMPAEENRQAAQRSGGLVRKFVTVGGATLSSRLVGFIRETMMAAALGAGPIADAFYAAFRFPNLFRRLFAEGAFNAAFIPLFAREIEGGGIDAARKFSEEVFGVLFTILLGLTVL